MKKLTITLLLILAAFLNTYSQDFWEKTNGLDSITIYSLAINTSGDIFAGTDTNGVFRSTDNGDNWLNLGFMNYKITSIVTRPSGEILIVTDDHFANGGVYRSTDNGNNWATLGLTNRAETSIAINDSGHIFVGTAAQGVYRSTDDGVNWVQINLGLSDPHPTSLIIDTSGYIFAGTMFGGVFRSTDNGDNWVQINKGITRNYVLSLAINSNEDIFAGTSNGGAFRSTDNGDNWVQINQGLTYDQGYYVLSLAINTNEDIFAGTADGIFRSTDNGDNWVQTNQGLTNFDVPSLAINLSGDVFAGTGDGIFRTIPSANIKVFLQGPYVSGSMSTTLRDNGYVPLVQPYNVAPFNYNGGEAVTSIPAGVVDWVLLELRSDLTTQVSRRAAFLRSDGTLVDLDGVSNVKFPTVTPGDYYVVIRHRNHLAVMTANPIELSYSPVLYDFSTAQAQAIGTNPMKDLGAGIFGLYSGDTNNSGIVTAADKSVVNTFNLSSGYYNADTNFSGIVTAADKTNINSNNLKQEFVP